MIDLINYVGEIIAEYWFGIVFLVAAFVIFGTDYVFGKDEAE